MLGIIDAIGSAASITPASMEPGKLVHGTSMERPRHGLEDLRSLENMPDSISEGMVLEETNRLGEMTRARELVQQIVKIRSDQRKEQVGRDIVPEQIVGIIQPYSGVYRVRVISPTYQQIADSEVAQYTSISVVKGTEYEES